MKVLVTVLLLLLSSVAHATQWLCVPDAGTGFKLVNGEWRATHFLTSDNQWIVSLQPKYDWALGMLKEQLENGKIDRNEPRYQEAIKKINSCPDETCFYSLIYRVTKVGEEEPYYDCEVINDSESLLTPPRNILTCRTFDEYFLLNTKTLRYTETRFTLFLQATPAENLTQRVEIGKCSPF